MRLRQLSLVLGLLLVIGVWGACVEIPNGPGTDIGLNYRSLVRFVNAIAGGAAADMKVDGASVGNLSFPNATAYLDVASGSRSLQFGALTTNTISFGSEQQSTLVVYPNNDGTTGYLNLLEGHLKKNNGKASKIKVKFVHVAQGSAPNLSFRVNSATGAPVTAADSVVPFGTATSYRELDSVSAPGAIFVVSRGGYNAALTGAAGTLSTGTGSVDLSLEGGVGYVVTVRSESQKGFFTSANVTNGLGGTSVRTISTTGMNITAASDSINGAQENPPVTTASSGRGTFSLNQTTGLAYSARISSANSQGFYTAAHFHQAPVGVNGGVVHDITASLAKQRITFPDSNRLSGSNEVPAVVTNSSGNVTATLYRDSLVYALSVTLGDALIDTTFTAAHFHVAGPGVNGPVRRTISSTPFKSTNFSGTWKRTDTEPLTDALIDSIVAGRVYANVHSMRNPGGVIRVQLVPKDTSTNVYSGTWPAASITPALRDAYLQKGLYINFHSRVNPGGQVRGQVIPDSFSVNTFSGTWNDSTLTNDLRTAFNTESLYFNFLTAASPTGDVTGQIKVDPARGQYGVATLAASSWEKGKMYTVIAAGKGSSLQLIKLADRQAEGPFQGKPAGKGQIQTATNGNN